MKSKVDSWIFILQENIKLEFVPLVRLDGRTTGDKLSQWHSSHQSLDKPESEALRWKGLADKCKVSFMPSSTIEYGDNISTVDEGIFYVPESATEMGFDSFIVVNGVLYIFQFTIASKHARQSSHISVFGGFGGDFGFANEGLAFCVCDPSWFNTYLPTITS